MTAAFRRVILSLLDKTKKEAPMPESKGKKAFPALTETLNYLLLSNLPNQCGKNKI
ncbi:MAG: hypothetical protein J6Z36_03440 [Clostridia bacterium]|nr:hypothetical protein [Clostridia bacterium]